MKRVFSRPKATVKRERRGFTLSEVLISLSILAIIYTISIPMMTTERQSSAKQAVLKETIDILNDVIQNGMMRDEINPNNFKDYFLSNVNAVKTCPNDSSGVEGCWSINPQGNFNLILPVREEQKGGLVLSTGATVVGFEQVGGAPNPAVPWGDNLVIDWNGTKPPNTMGEDQLYVVLCYGHIPCNTYYPNQSPGSVMPVIQPNAGLPILSVRQADDRLFKKLYTDNN